ncbi:hypothetical protein [Staphylococcus phage vB_SauH_DELF3]|nr:hypothetical protein [Staphylococcus phage vB_SauH_DELF3]
MVIVGAYLASYNDYLKVKKFMKDMETRSTVTYDNRSVKKSNIILINKDIKAGLKMSGVKIVGSYLQNADKENDKSRSLIEQTQDCYLWTMK